MATKRSLILYPDGSKAFVKASERDEMLVRGEIAHLDTYRYKYIAQPRTFHSFADLATLQFQPKGLIKRYIGLSCIFEFAGKRRIEHEFSPDDAAIRLQSQPA